MSSVQSKKQSTREQFIDFAKEGKILLNQCLKCKNLFLETAYYCNNCFSNSFKHIPYEGKGKVITYTIQSVSPEGFEDVDAFAWVVFRVEECGLNVSGFLRGISSPTDLPLGTEVKVVDFSDKHGLILEKSNT